MYCTGLAVLLGDFSEGYRIFMAFFFRLESNIVQGSPSVGRAEVCRRISAHKGGGLNRRAAVAGDHGGFRPGVASLPRGAQRLIMDATKTNYNQIGYLSPFHLWRVHADIKSCIWGAEREG